MDFWSNALPIMNKKGIKRADISRATGKSRSAVTDWIKRKVFPTADDALIIADLLGVSLRYLITGQEEGISSRERELLDVCRLLPDRKFSIVLKNAQAIREEMESESENGLSYQDLEEVKRN